MPKEFFSFVYIYIQIYLYNLPHMDMRTENRMGNAGYLKLTKTLHNALACWRCSDADRALTDSDLPINTRQTVGRQRCGTIHGISHILMIFFSEGSSAKL